MEVRVRQLPDPCDAVAGADPGRPISSELDARPSSSLSETQEISRSTSKEEKEWFLKEQGEQKGNLAINKTLDSRLYRHSCKVAANCIHGSFTHLTLDCALSHWVVWCARGS